MKASETAEEKRARRQLKKEAKQRRLRERMGWDQEMMVRERESKRENEREREGQDSLIFLAQPCSCANFPLVLLPFCPHPIFVTHTHTFIIRATQMLTILLETSIY